MHGSSKDQPNPAAIRASWVAFSWNVARIAGRPWEAALNAIVEAHQRLADARRSGDERRRSLPVPVAERVIERGDAR